MTLLAQRHLMLRHVIGLAPLIALVAPVDRAEAACDPITSSANPVINTIVTCTGPTTDQNGTTGYGVPEDRGNTINVEAGASVTGTQHWDPVMEVLIFLASPRSSTISVPFREPVASTVFSGREQQRRRHHFGDWGGRERYLHLRYGHGLQLLDDLGNSPRC